MKGSFLMGDEYRLSFCLLKRLPGRIVEVVPDAGVEIDLPMVAELDRTMIAMMGDTFAILVNKVNSYSVSFEAQIKIGLLEEVKATAVVAYDSFGAMGAQQIKDMTEGGGEKKIDIFFDKVQAISSLEEKMAAFP